MQRLYQCLLYCSHPGQNEAGILVTASGPNIHTFSVQHGTHLFTWLSTQYVQEDTVTNANLGVSDETNSGQEVSQRPQKRRRLSIEREESCSSAEIVVNGIMNGRISKAKQAANPPVTKLASTSNGRHVVAATGGDKSIRVFKLSEDGSLIQLSERVMPKRPCAVVLTPDDTTILCADKFGDVYSLPLLGQTYDPTVRSDDTQQIIKSELNGRPKKSYIPSATSLTVHTQGNREALRQQQQITNSKAETKCLNFDHKLLLGHVSLLTDIAYVSIPSSSRKYILSSDRDEHIRVSRGIPQTHIIERYCLGHTEFVSKLCVPPTQHRLLISGGGDDYLLLWDWLSGSIRQKVDLRGPVETFKKYHGYPGSARIVAETPEIHAGERNAKVKIAVSSIQVPQKPVKSPNILHDEVIVTCEGVPALFMFSLDADATMQFIDSVPLQGNVIDLVSLRELGTILYSIDTVHEPFTTTLNASDENRIGRLPLGLVDISSSSGSSEKAIAPRKKLVAAMKQCIEDQPFIMQEVTAKGRSLKELLYGLEGLRKCAGEEQNHKGDQIF